MAQVQPAVAPLQTRFDGGEISPRLSGRFDSELYKKALRSCRNFEPLPQGSLRMRSGSIKSSNLAGDIRTKLISIRLSTGSDFLVELYEKVLRLYSLDGTIAALTTVQTAEVISNGDFTQPNGAGWLGRTKVGNWLQDNDTNVSFTDFGGQTLGYGVQYTCPNGPTAGVIYQRIVVPFNAAVHLQFDMVSNIAISGDHLKVKISTSDPAGWANIWTGGGESFLYDNVPAGLIAAGSGNPFAGTPYTHVDLGNVNLNAGIYWISFQVPVSNLLKIDNVSAIATFGVPITDIPTPWSANEIGDVKFVTETGRDRTIFVHPGHKPWFLLNGGQTTNWSFGDILFTGLPVAWGDAGSNNVPVGWNWQGQSAVLAQANWPSCVEMRDGRVYYAGEPAQKNRILGSRSGSPDDFTIGANPGDALDFKLATKGAIKWLRSHRILLAGTDLGEHSITGSKGTPLVGDIQAQDQSAFPSAGVQAVTVGTQALYVSSDLRRVRAATFDFQTQGWESKDITFVAEHLTDPLSAGLVKELLHAWTPDSMNIVVRQDGKLALCTFEPTEQVTAWWTIDLGGFICSAAVSQGPLGAYLWMAVQRGGSLYLEKLHLSESTEVLRYFDSSIAAQADGAGQVAGLDHLNGVIVGAVIQGGGYLGTFRVAAGVVQLGADNANAEVFVGVPYLASAKTLPRDTRHGKAQSPKLGVILNNSALPKLNGKRAADRTPATPMNTVEPLVTGKRTVGNLGWSDEDSITIEQDLPFRTEICALYSATQTEQGL